MSIARGLLGIAVLLLLAWLLSSRRGAVNWRLVLGCLLLQIIIAFFVLKTDFSVVVSAVSKGFVTLMGYTAEGSAMVFGDLVKFEKFGFVLAFQVLPTIIFVSALTSLLYYFGILQWIVFGMAWLMRMFTKLVVGLAAKLGWRGRENQSDEFSGAEILATAANVFVGQTEAPLLVKPYIPKMTRSEIMTLMTGGMATIAGSVLAAYIGILGGGDVEEQQRFGTILLCASLMNAPAALLAAKILVPETKEIDSDLFIPRDRIGSNALDAVAQGTTDGLKLALNVGAMLIAFIALVALLNGILGGVGVWFGMSELSLGMILGYVFAPIAWAVGISGAEVLAIGELLGTKMVLNEFVAYNDLGKIKEELSDRSIQIATFALCGFANLGSIGIQLGGIGALAPEQRPILASLGFKAMLAGTLASLLSAAVAGMFI